MFSKLHRNRTSLQRFSCSQLVVDTYVFFQLLGIKGHSIDSLKMISVSVLIAMIAAFCSSIIEGKFRSNLSSSLVVELSSLCFMDAKSSSDLMHYIQREALSLSKFIKAAIESVLYLMMFCMLIAIALHQFEIPLIGVQYILATLIAVAVVIAATTLVGILRTNAAKKLSASVWKFPRARFCNNSKPYK